jgi:hypothetical protein
MVGVTGSLRRVAAWHPRLVVTDVTEGGVNIVLKEQRDTVIFSNLQSQRAKTEGLGSYLPKIGLDGTFDVSHRLDRAIKNARRASGGLNTPGVCLSTENRFFRNLREVPGVYWRV